MEVQPDDQVRLSDFTHSICDYFCVTVKPHCPVCSVCYTSEDAVCKSRAAAALNTLTGVTSLKPHWCIYLVSVIKPGVLEPQRKKISKLDFQLKW